MARGNHDPRPLTGTTGDLRWPVPQHPDLKGRGRATQ